MTRFFRALGIILVLSSPLLAQTTAPAARGPATIPSATVPMIQRGTDNRHAQFLEIAKKGDIDLLFIGDSITDNWRRDNGRNGGKGVWDKYFGDLKAANFGIGADRTQNVLWRVQNGELEGFKARCIVMMLGTNNINTPQAPRNTAEETIAGYKLVVNEIRARQPQAKLLLLAIFPRGPKPEDRHPGLKQVNDEIAKLADNKTIFFLDINNKFLGTDGTLSAEIFPDLLHPNDKGYEIWGSAVIDKIKELMKN